MIWTLALTLDGEHPAGEPKRLRSRVLHVAGQLTRPARTATLHLPTDWPWVGAIIRAFGRLEDLPRTPREPRPDTPLSDRSPIRHAHPNPGFLANRG